MSATTRSSAVLTASSRSPRTFVRPVDGAGRLQRISAYFGSKTFSAEKMRDRVPPEIFRRWVDTVEHGKRLDRAAADAIAHAVKEWALENGATHFSHWFHPMTGSTAEKHDSFLWFDREGRPIEKFTGAMLLQSEPDASSFPSGGVRSTFEARGYTAWDPTSPMFLMDSPTGVVLVIPSAFIGYHGQALDEKAPLLRSMEALSRSALALLELLGETGVHRVTPTVGPEQEYFLVDRAFLSARPDLHIAGRSLLGAQAPKGQTLEDHYFGSIPVRVRTFMEEVETELYKLGVSAKTRHNEVAPGQFEIAPIFAEANIAADHNQLVMQTLRTVGARHDFAVLLHEKPFAFVNGSGKHVNWSLGDNRGENYLEPGQNPTENLRFLAFLGAVLLGVHRNAALLRASIASHGNDFRLGANEAPPAIISVFLGDFLTKVCDALAAGELSGLDAGQAMLELGIARLPLIAKDNTDRNRTSPFAFTGNKFEFRAVGSSASISFPTTCLNVAVADGVDQVVTWAKEAGGGRAGVMAAVRKAVIESTPVRFDGNGYSTEWVEEAERRGLPHARNTPSALRALASDRVRAVFTRLNVLSEEELRARYDVRVEQYVKKVEIEEDVLVAMVSTQVLPAVYREIAELGAGASGLGAGAGELLRLRAEELAAGAKRVLDARAALGRAGHEGHGDDLAAHAAQVCRDVVPALAALREAVDDLERVAADERWPLPKYSEMLFPV